MKKILWTISVLVVVGVGVFFFVQRDSGESEQETVNVSRGDVAQTVSVSGVLEPVEFADLAFQAIGEVEWVGVDVGDRVKKGDPLVRLDRDTLLADLADARKSVEIAEQDRLNMRRNYDDLKPEEREKINLAKSQAQTRVNKVLATLKNLTLVAPIDGIVTKQEADEGEAVDEVGALVRIIDDSAFVVKANIPESDIVGLEIGENGVASFDALDPTDTTDARITVIEPEATVIQDVVYYETTFELSSTDARLRSGMSVDIDITTDEQHNVLVLPRRVLRETDTGVFVLLRDPGGAPREQEIQIGLIGDLGDVEILSGVREGDSIVVDNE